MLSSVMRGSRAALFTSARTGFLIAGDLLHPADDLGFASEVDTGERDSLAEIIGQRSAGHSIGVAEEDAGALRMEGPDNGRADAIGAAGHQDSRVAQVSVGGHGAVYAPGLAPLQRFLHGTA